MDNPSSSSVRDELNGIKATLALILESLQPDGPHGSNGLSDGAERRTTRSSARDRGPKEPPDSKVLMEKLGEIMAEFKNLEARIDKMDQQQAANPPKAPIRTPLPNSPGDKTTSSPSPAEIASRPNANEGTHQSAQPRVPPAREDEGMSAPDQPQESQAGGESTSPPADSASPPAHQASTETSSANATPDSTGFTLTRRQLGKRMPETFFKLSQTPGFANKVRLPWITDGAFDVDIKEVLEPEKEPDVKCNIFRRRQDGGINVFRDDPETGREFGWPKFEPEEVPTVEQAVERLEAFIKNPDQEVSYYCGVMKTSVYDNCPLYPGKELAEAKGLTHANETYTHLGEKNSATPMHFEDARLGSVNVGLRGIKLFILIKPTHTEKFEEWVRSNWDCKPCPQFVRHLNMLFGPKQLKCAGIEADYVLQKPGDAIYTRRGQYHQVQNMTDSWAISINTQDPGTKPCFYDSDNPLEVCNECGFKGLYGKEGFYVKWVDSDVAAPAWKRKAVEHGGGRPKKTTRTHTAATAELSKLLKKILEADPQCNIPEVDENNTQQLDVLYRVAAIRSSHAMKQLMSLVAEWRGSYDHNATLDSNDGTDVIERHVISLKKSLHKSRLSKFMVRLAQMSIANEIDTNKGTGTLRASTTQLEAIAEKHGICKSAIDQHLQEGRNWRGVCGGLEGLLPLILLDSYNPFHITKKEWQALRGKSAFHDLLNDEYVQCICAAGKVFQDIVMFGSRKVFWWENEELDLGAHNRALLISKTLGAD
ncbi:domain-containing histone demethylation 3D [Fusarium albosuccineum]|uniref:Domain-containing histone demethylation 3D n=1 Tax=Fusarium albosuccineum TaxID=1237068 RepID=A0A8H4LQ98_9HYPO|nr:domain-containing histone demethylation 3D [Fusarium albosuccineum]